MQRENVDFNVLEEKLKDVVLAPEKFNEATIFLYPDEWRTENNKSEPYENLAEACPWDLMRNKDQLKARIYAQWE